MRIGTFLVMMFFAVLVVGCGSKSAAPPSSSLQPSSTHLSLNTLQPDEAQSICLADPTGSSALDVEIRKLQKQAAALSAKPDKWILVGRAWVRKARISADPGFYINVEACVDTTLAVEPENPAALGLRGLALMNNHKFKDAEIVAERVLQKNPKDWIALCTRSDALLELGQFQESAETTQQMMDYSPGMASYARASYLRWLQGDTKTAKQLIRDALDGRDTRDPEPTAWTFVQAGMIFWNEADYEGADAVFAEALKWVPDYPIALVWRARSAMALNQPDRAVEYLEKAYRIYPLPETAWLLGDARAMMGDSKNADVEYERVVQQGRKMDKLTLALFYASKNRDISEAMQLIQEERKTRGGIYVDDAYAWVLYRAGKIQEARALSDQAMRLGTKDARLLYHAGAIRLAQEDPTGRNLVQEALSLNPKFDWTGASEAAKLVECPVNNINHPEPRRGEKIVAHGVSRGYGTKNSLSPVGAKELE